jgi:hypothetical protein
MFNNLKTLLENLYPHPYLGFVQQQTERCPEKINSLGNLGTDFPEKKEDYYTILVLGGSVAFQLVANKNYIEEYHNNSFYSPTKNRCRHKCLRLQ